MLLKQIYHPLTETQVEIIHERSLDVLETVGFSVTNPRLRALLAAGGAAVTDGSDRVKLPRALVLACIKKAPSEVTLCGKTPEYDLRLGCDEVYIGTGGRPNLVIDLDTRERRATTLRDVRDLVRLVDRLDQIDFCVIPSEATDIPRAYIDVNNIFYALCYTRKHVMDGVSSPENLRLALQIAAELAGGKEKLRERPLLSIITNVISPLKIDSDVGDILLDCAEYGIPVVCSTAPIAGVTAPVTLEGSLVQQNAESLFGVVVTQLAHPGTPYLYGASLATTNFRNMNFLFAGVEMGMMNACAAQMARWYKLPIYASAGPSDAKIGDCQAGAEKAMNILQVAMAGGHYLHLAAGLLDGGLTTSFEQLVIDNDILGMVKRVLRGYTFDDDHLAAEVIEEVGPGGNYLGEMHTFEHMRTEFFTPATFSLDSYASWDQAGRPECRDTAQKLAKELLQAAGEPCVPAARMQALLDAYPNILQPL